MFVIVILIKKHVVKSQKRLKYIDLLFNDSTFYRKS